MREIWFVTTSPLQEPLKSAPRWVEVGYKLVLADGSRRDKPVYNLVREEKLLSPPQEEKEKRVATKTKEIIVAEYIKTFSARVTAVRKPDEKEEKEGEKQKRVEEQKREYVRAIAMGGKKRTINILPVCVDFRVTFWDRERKRALPSVPFALRVPILSHVLRAGKPQEMRPEDKKNLGIDGDKAPEGGRAERGGTPGRPGLSGADGRQTVPGGPRKPGPSGRLR